MNGNVSLDEMLGNYMSEISSVNALTYEGLVKVLMVDIIPSVMNAHDIPEEERVTRFSIGIKIAREACGADPDIEMLNGERARLQERIDSGKYGPSMMRIDRYLIDAMDALVNTVKNDPDATGTMRIRCRECGYEKEVPLTASVMMMDCESCGEEGSYTRAFPPLF